MAWGQGHDQWPAFPTLHVGWALPGRTKQGREEWGRSSGEENGREGAGNAGHAGTGSSAFAHPPAVAVFSQLIMLPKNLLTEFHTQATEARPQLVLIGK